ncbi:hypothetical protein BS47DRAFT_1336120 [Hydnum rufescens UP504]|uniref:Uncharacterized protein n=1 Tax=Hydnum rufescens UP504 TaxID=1448309 RepID=A0A9P6E2E8_9AGAM|nr:hypothetical protein BS47DRAFT_1336120 [Hydnum rufescens UP504]
MYITCYPLSLPFFHFHLCSPSPRTLLLDHYTSHNAPHYCLFLFISGTSAIRASTSSSPYQSYTPPLPGNLSCLFQASASSHTIFLTILFRAFRADINDPPSGSNVPFAL